MIDFVRTPASRFRGIPDYPFEPRYFEVDGLRMHYVDEGPTSASPVLLLHGEPSWSFLYRHMIAKLVAKGHRTIAPDLIGFGKSDKPTRQEDYSVARHVGWVGALVEALDLEDITLFGQDWGSTIGLRLACENERRFSRIVIGNGLLAGENGVETKRLIIRLWQAFTRWSPCSATWTRSFRRAFRARCVNPTPASKEGTSYKRLRPRSSHGGSTS